MLSECGSGPQPAAYVYRIYDGGVLLYVGCTENLKRRIRDHSKKDWMTASVRVEADFYFDAATAFMHERQQIAALRPLHDMTWRRKIPTGPLPKTLYACHKCKRKKTLVYPGVCSCNGRLNRRRAAQIAGVDGVTRNQINRLCGPRHKKPKEGE